MLQEYHESYNISHIARVYQSYNISKSVMQHAGHQSQRRVHQPINMHITVTKKSISVMWQELCHCLKNTLQS